MRAEITVQRFNPDLQEAASFVSVYPIDYDRGTTLLSALLAIKADQDGTLTFRASCRAAICGSCAMEVNGTTKLACKVSLREELQRRGKIHVRPMANMPVVKDMVVEMGPFWEKVKGITPYVVFPPSGALPNLAGITEDLHNADGCIMCAACLAACTTFAVSPGFLGPAALAKAYRFLADPRDTTHTRRLELLQRADGIWDCVRCNFCVAVCPKEVAPMEQIMRLRRLSLGFSQTVGARHITQFTKIIGREGRLNETLLPILMIRGNFKKMLRMLPLAIKMLLRGKMPFPFKRPEGYEKVRRLFDIAPEIVASGLRARRTARGDLRVHRCT